MSTSIPSDVRALSRVWISGGTSEELRACLKCSSKHYALVRVCTFRNMYGEKLFPYRKRDLAQGGYSKAKVRKLSRLWIAGASADRFAEAAGLGSQASTWGTLRHLRIRYGSELFPQRRSKNIPTKNRKSRSTKS